MNVRRIMVPIDYSDHSRRALEYAAELAARFGASLDVVHVWDRPTYVPEGLTVGPKGEAKSLGDLIRDNAEREMHEFLAKVTAPEGVRIESRLISGDPASAIVHSCTATKPDLVVVGTHGRTGVQHLLMGSVAEKIVRLSPVPVLSVPPADRARAAGG